MNALHRFSVIILTLCVGHFVFVPYAQGQVWELVWADEFDTDGLPDPARWSYDVGGNGWGNQELQYYTENRTENARVENGVLVIEALKEAFGGNQYTSARLVTREKGDWTYGRIEARAKLPAGRGTWPAIWMLPTNGTYGNGGWPDNGEIDIMEHVGFDPGVVHGTVHTDAYNHSIGTQRGGSRPVSDALDDFHTYAIEWSPVQIDFYIDDVVYFRHFNQNTGWTTWPFDRPFHLLLNIAIGGSWGGQQGIDDTIFPARMEVDYVRVYENTALPEVSLDAPATLDPGTPVTLTAEATISEGTIESVTFFQRDGVLGVDTEAPYTLTIDNAEPGCYQVGVQATDVLGWSTATELADLNVGTECQQAPYLMAAHTLPGRVEAEYFDLGGSGVGYVDLDGDNQGGAIRSDEGVDIESTSDQGGGYNIGWTAGREWLQYTVNVQQARVYTLAARVASPSGEGRFEVWFDGEDKTGEVNVPTTGDWQRWQTVSVDSVNLDAGQQVMRVRVKDGGFNLNHLTFMAQTGTNTAPRDLPDGFALEANYPNPFDRETRVGFILPEAGPVILEIFDGYGRRVAILVDEHRPAGKYHTDFEADRLPSGVYYYRLTTPETQMTRPLMLMK